MIEMVEKTWGKWENERKEKWTPTLKIQKTLRMLCTASKLVKGKQPPSRLLARCCSKGEPEGQEASPASRMTASDKQWKDSPVRLQVPTPRLTTTYRKGTSGHQAPLALFSSWHSIPVSWPLSTASQPQRNKRWPTAFFTSPEQQNYIGLPLAVSSKYSERLEGSPKPP